MAAACAVWPRLEPRGHERKRLQPAATFSAMFHAAVMAASPVPSFFCGVYSTLNSAKFSVTF